MNRIQQFVNSSIVLGACLSAIRTKDDKIKLIAAQINALGTVYLTVHPGHHDRLDEVLREFSESEEKTRGVQREWYEEGRLENLTMFEIQTIRVETWSIYKEIVEDGVTFRSPVPTHGKI